jgi:hypothetical protein
MFSAFAVLIDVFSSLIFEGRGWGEDGMVRVRRGDGKKGTPGTCGIARSPSVALGGTLSQRFKSNDLRGGIVGDNSTAIYDLMEESRNDGFCSRIGFGFEGPCFLVGSIIIGRIFLECLVF